MTIFEMYSEIIGDNFILCVEFIFKYFRGENVEIDEISDKEVMVVESSWWGFRLLTDFCIMGNFHNKNNYIVPAF